MQKRAFVELDQVTKNFQAGELTVPALRGVNLTVLSGEIVVLLGPSGSGKTTTLNLIGGLDKPSGGDIWVNDHNIAAYTDEALTDYRRLTVGFVFQFFNLIPTLTAAENVEFALALTEKEKAVVDQRVNELLAAVGLSGEANRFPSQLSGGQQQRVAIARSLANAPLLLLCDEPTGNLDVATGQQVLQVISDLNQQSGITVILVTHNVALAKMAHKVVRMSDGTIHHVAENRTVLPVNQIEW
jgi:putative ABC transport system ATP-binding protein